MPQHPAHHFEAVHSRSSSSYSTSAEVDPEPHGQQVRSNPRVDEEAHACDHDLVVSEQGHSARHHGLGHVAARRSFGNMIVTNVPAAPFTAYLLGARLLESYPPFRSRRARC
jgi:hypothetical protein